MSDRQQLRDIWRPVGEAIVPAREQRKLAAMASAFGVDGLRPDALARALPAYTFPWYLTGAISTGTNVGAEYDIPSMVRLTSLRARAKTSPTSNECTIRLTADGGEVDIVSIGIGESRGVSPLNYIAEAGVVLRIDVVTDGDAEDVTILAAYAPTST